MAESFHHGPEVIEHFANSQVVVDIKAATIFIVGTAPVHVVHPLLAEQSGFINKLIIIRRVEDAVAAYGAAKDGAGYSLPQALQTIFNKNRGSGIGTIVAVNVFDPSIHKTAGVPDVTKVTALDIIGGISASGVPTGLSLSYACFNRLGFFPRRIIAPNFSELASVRAEMSIVANKLHAHYIADLPLGYTKQQAVEARGTTGSYNTASERAVLCYPRVKGLDAVTGDFSLQPLSTQIAGLWNEAVVSEGVQYSPSNREMVDVNGTETDIYFYPSDTASDTDLLNSVGLVTVMNMYGTGFRNWGNRSAAFPSISRPTMFLHARQIMDVIHETILYYLLPKVDQPITKAYLDDTEEKIAAWLRTKENGDTAWLYGSKFRFDRIKNTPEEIAGNGHIYYKLDTAPIGVAERITVDSYIDLGFVSKALSLTI